MAVSLRQTKIPNDLIVMISQSTIPSGYVYECALADRFPVGVPNSCTNPGGSVGCATHSHTTGQNHNNHPVSTGHTHTSTSPSSGSTPNPASGPPGSACSSFSNHTHTVTSGSTTPCPTVSTPATHTHSAVAHDPPFQQIKFITRSCCSSHIRNNKLSLDVLSFWTKNNACIPANFCLDTAHFGNYLKQTTNACDAPGCTGGATTHAHGSTGAHTHTVTIPSHGHPAGSIGGGSPPIANNTGGCTTYVTASHTHAIGSVAFSPAGASCGVTNCTGSHNHANHTHTPQFFEVGLIQQTSINMRHTTIPNDLTFGFLQPLACIPSCYLLADGTCSTDNMLSKHAKVIANACTNPGTTGGSDNHCDVSDGSHSHTMSVCHNHGVSGTSGPSPNTQLRSPSGPQTRNLNHTHPFNNPSSTQTFSSTGCGGAHTHGSATNIPQSIRIAYIQKRV